MNGYIDYYCIGGLAGINNGSIMHCYTTGSISGDWYVGGLVGDNYSGTITSCYSTSTINGTTRVGGLVGNNYSGTIAACYATGSVNGSLWVGGLVGTNNNTITSCYAASIVSCDQDVGGLIGINYHDTIDACFWDTQVSNQTNGVGYGFSEGVMGKTTTDMMLQSTFASAEWDFSDSDGDAADWMMRREGEDYPRLAWQTVYPADIAGLYGVDIADLTEIVNNWLEQDCSTNCEQADMDNNGTVDLADLSILAANWLR